MTTSIFKINGKEIDISSLSEPSIEREEKFHYNVSKLPFALQAQTLRSHRIFWTSGAVKSINADLQKKPSPFNLKILEM